MQADVVWFYAFDVANEIQHAKVAEVLAEKPRPFSVNRDHTTPRDLPFHQPLSVEPVLHLTVAEMPARVQVRLYEVGVISITVRISVTAADLQDLTKHHRPLLNDGSSLDHFAKDLCNRVSEEIAAAVKRRSTASEPEAYTAFCITRLDEPHTADVWFEHHRSAIAALLANLPSDRLTDEQVSEILRSRHSSDRHDLIVVNWDAALIVDLNGSTEDELFVIELANVQLEEFHALDRMLDRYREQTYAHLEQRPRWLLGRSSRVLRKLRWFRVDLARLADEVTNITKFIGDWHLARVYECARDRFHLAEWRESVERRLGQIDNIFQVIHAEISDRRMAVMEIIIILLILIEVLNTFFGRH